MSSIQFGSGLGSVGSLSTPKEMALRSQALLVARLTQNGFVSADLRARFDVSPESLDAERVRLLGGAIRLVQKTMTLKPGESFVTETSRTRGRKVHVSTEYTAHVTVMFQEPGERERVLFSGPFTGTNSFARRLPLGYFQLVIKNNTNADVVVYVHTEDENHG